jgi:Spy/CpxP family protein refolding chaperone
MVMKRFHLVAMWVAMAIAFGALGTASRAGDPPQTQPARPDGPSSILSRVKQAAESVKLTNEQKKRLNTMFQRAGSDLTSTAEKFKDDAETRTKEAQAVLDKLRQDMSKLLNDDQKEEFRKKYQSLGSPSGLLDRIATQLKQMDLSDEQKKKIDQIMADARTEFEQLRDQARSGSQEAREKLLDLFSDTLRKMESVLSPEQLQKLRDNLKSSRSQTEPSGNQSQ